MTNTLREVGPTWKINVVARKKTKRLNPVGGVPVRGVGLKDNRDDNTFIDRVVITVYASIRKEHLRMNRCMTVEDGVKIALDIYSYKLDKKWKYCPANTQEYTDKLWIDGEEFPLFWWRKDTQIDSLYQLAPERKPCSMKLSRVCSKKIGLEKLLYKELDISEYVLRSEIKSVMSFRNGQSMNMLATMHNACISSFELAATLNENTVEQGRHFLWGEDGMISDKVVSQKITSEAVYLFTEEEEKPEVYNDIFIYMYGLEKADVCRAVMIAQILMGQVSISDWKSRDKHYTKCITAVADSNKMGKKIYVEEV